MKFEVGWDLAFYSLFTFDHEFRVDKREGVLFLGLMGGLHSL